MIVETTPTGPRSPIGRVMRALGLVLPVILLGVVVGAGVLGPRPTPEPAGPSPVPSAADASPRTPPEPPETPAAPVTIAIDTRVAFPTVLANLRVRRVPEVRAAQVMGEGGTVVAVAGYLRAWVVPQACTAPIAGLPGGGCTRQAFLTEAPWASGRSEGLGGIGEHLHAIVPPGVSVPDSAVGLITNDARQATPVVIIGRYGAGGEGCIDDLRSCDEPFVIERVAWAAGQRLGLGRQVSAGMRVAPSDPLASDPDVVASRTLGPLTDLLRLVLLDPAALTAVDPFAAAALASSGAGPTGPVWYVRGFQAPSEPLPESPYGPASAVIRWAVVDAASGRTLAASGSAERSAG